jgi:hypothetical protein
MFVMVRTGTILPFICHVPLYITHLMAEGSSIKFFSGKCAEFLLCGHKRHELLAPKFSFHVLNAAK